MIATALDKKAILQKIIDEKEEAQIRFDMRYKNVDDLKKELDKT